LDEFPDETASPEVAKHIAGAFFREKVDRFTTDLSVNGFALGLPMSRVEPMLGYFLWRTGQAEKSTGVIQTMNRQARSYRGEQILGRWVMGKHDRLRIFLFLFLFLSL
jgi:hypothetical protein